MKERVVWYRDELADDFAGTHIRTKPLRPEYRYVHTGPLWRAASFFLYRLVALPLIWLFVKLAYGQRFRNRRVLRAVRGSGAYVYANHTNACLDAFAPNLLDWRRRCYIVVGPDAMSIPGLNDLIEMLGGIPLGSSLRQKDEMRRCVETRVREKALVAIYPEAHIWPWYTGIRPYSAASFAYPARDGAPVYAMTNCYEKRPLCRRPRVVTWLDGPFFPDLALPLAERRDALRSACLAAMRSRAQKYSTCEYVKYRRAAESAPPPPS